MHSGGKGLALGQASRKGAHDLFHHGKRSRTVKGKSLIYKFKGAETYVDFSKNQDRTTMIN